VRLLRRGGGSSLDYLVVGLGNPGRRYERTRHNLGFRAVDLMGERLGASWRDRYQGRLAEVRDGDLRLALLEPQTYMNLSGRSVAQAVGFYKLPLEQLLVVHDEIDLPFGDVRAKRGGGMAGHNGLRSLRESLGSADFLRVRAGVGRPERGDRRPVADWLLAPFEPHEDDAALVERSSECALDVVRRGIDAAMREWNGAGPPQPSRRD
jgi:peptidyl-tRNA hydrolase, PTH1 family